MWTQIIDEEGICFCIEADEALARDYFCELTGTDKLHSHFLEVTEANTLREITAFERDCRIAVPKNEDEDEDEDFLYSSIILLEEDDPVPDGFRLYKERDGVCLNYVKLEEYLEQANVKVIRSKQVASFFKNHRACRKLDFRRFGF